MLLNLVWIFLYVSQTNGNQKCSATNHSYMVAIFYNSNESYYFLGSGTLLSQSWVLTASMFLSKEQSPYYHTVVAGATSLLEFQLNKPHVQMSLVKSYYYSKNVVKDNWDVALMKLENKIHTSMTVSYVRLATNKKNIKNKELEKTCDKATMIGYGTQFTDRDTKYRHLYCTQISVISQKECHKKLSFFNLEPQMACMFNKENVCDVDNYMGDVGGPVMCNGVQYGVLTGGFECQQETPIIFLRVTEYEDFFKPKKIKHNKILWDKESKCSSNNFINLFLLFLSVFFYLVTV